MKVRKNNHELDLVETMLNLNFDKCSELVINWVGPFGPRINEGRVLEMK